MNNLQEKAMKMALEALVNFGQGNSAPAEALRQALSQPEQNPVAWLLTDCYANKLQVDSIQRLIDRAKHAHMIDLKLRINGQDEWYEVDWLKHLTRTAPPKTPCAWPSNGPTT